MTTTTGLSSRKQHGLSLISLLVGLTLALICVVAAMHTYRVSVLNSRTAASSARASNVTAALSMQLNKLLPQAGWGMGVGQATPGGIANTDFVLLQGAKAVGPSIGGQTVSVSTANQTGNGLVWATAITGTTQCYAMVHEAASGVTLRGPQACVSASAAAAAAWGASQSIVAPEVFPALTFSASIGKCWPFSGSGAVSARDSVQVQVSGARYTLPQVCLANIHA